MGYLMFVYNFLTHANRIESIIAKNSSKGQLMFSFSISRSSKVVCSRQHQQETTLFLRLA